MGVTRVLFVVAGLSLWLAVGVAPRSVATQEIDRSGGVNSASALIAENAAVQSSWITGGCSFRADPVPADGPGNEVGASHARARWDISVYNYQGTQLLLTVRLQGFGNQPASRAAKAITQAVAFLQRNTSMTGAEVRLSFDTGVAVRARSLD